MEDGEAVARPEGKGDADRRFEELGREWLPRAAAYARAFGGLSAEDREDLAAEAVAKAWLAIDGYDERRPFAPWFFAIVRRLTLDALDRKRREGAFGGASCGIDPLAEAVSTHRGAEEELLRKETAGFVAGFVAGLPPADRELASLVYGQDLRLAEAARVAGMAVGTAKWRLFEIRKALRKAWEREYGEA
ncbi:MAG: RNA polymerase sigma factor [Spirochaetaceae bacterium]|nr:RNA polymerase sigma factor [Spirochaetaceae bacterium]